MRLWEKILIVLAVISLIFLGIARTIGAAPVAAKDVIQNGVVTRIARPGTVFWGEPVDVEVRIDANKLPPCQKPQAPPPPIYTALVIDRSGSMSPDRKIEEARNSASEFVDSMDLAKDGGAVAVIAFDDAAKVVHKFSYDRRDVRLAIASIQANGGTNIADGLSKAGEQFAAARPPAGAISVIILLSDGQSDPVSAIQEADNLKAQGIHIATVALGADADLDTLQRIASSDSDYYHTANAAELLDIYDDIVSGMVGIVATDVTLVEYFNDKSFEVSGETYRGNQSGNRLTWQLPFVGRLGRSAGYFLLPRSLGWHQISETPGQLDLTDCNEQPFSQQTPTGPGVLVLFPVWLLYIFPALALIWLIIRLILWLKREPPKKPRTPPPLPPLEPTIPNPQESLGDSHDWYANKELIGADGSPLLMRIGGSRPQLIKTTLRNKSSASVHFMVEDAQKMHLGRSAVALAAREELDKITRKRLERREIVIREFDIPSSSRKKGVDNLLLEQIEDTGREYNIQEIRFPNPGEEQEFFIAHGYRSRRNEEGEIEVFKSLTDTEA